MQTDLKNGNRGGFLKLYDIFNGEDSKAMGIHKVDELITGIQVFANSGAAGNVTIKVYGIK